MRARPWLAILALAAGLPLLGALAIVWIAERGEVAVIETGAAGERTRIWVVEIDGRTFVRGARAGAWVARLEETPAVRLRRGGAWRAYRAIPREDARAAVVAAMREKYGLAERVRAALRGDAGSRVFELAPLDPEREGPRSAERGPSKTRASD